MDSYTESDPLTIEDLQKLGEENYKHPEKSKTCSPDGKNTEEENLFSEITRLKQEYITELWTIVRNPRWIKRMKKEIKEYAKNQLHFYSDTIFYLHPCDNRFAKSLFTIDCIGLKIPWGRDIQVIVNTLYKHWFSDLDDFSLVKVFHGFEYVTKTAVERLDMIGKSVRKDEIRYEINLVSLILLDQDFMKELREYFIEQGFEMTFQVGSGMNCEIAFFAKW